MRSHVGSEKVRRIAAGVYEIGRFTIVRVNHGHGIEWELHRGDLDAYCGAGDTWVQTFPCLSDALEGLSHL